MKVNDLLEKMYEARLKSGLVDPEFTIFLGYLDYADLLRDPNAQHNIDPLRMSDEPVRFNGAKVYTVNSFRYIKVIAE